MSLAKPALWPSSLPQAAIVSSGQVDRLDNRLTFQPDSGSAIMRRKTTTPLLSWSAPLPPMTAAQFEAFLDFGENDLGGFVYPFAWEFPLRKEIRAMYFAPKQNPYRMEKVGLLVKLTLTLIIYDFTPPWAQYLTTANGYMQVVDRTAWDAL